MMPSPQIAAALGAGLVTGLISVSISISLAALIFSGPLTPFLPLGLGMILLGGIVIRVIMMVASRLIVPLGTPLVEQLVLVAGASAAIQAAHPGISPERLFVAISGGVILITLLTGILLWSLGRFGAGAFLQRLPGSVVIGFVGVTGYLLIDGSSKLAFGLPAPALLSSNFDTVVSPKAAMVHSMAVFLLLGDRSGKGPLLIPLTLLGRISLFWVMAFVSGATMVSAS